MSKYRFKTKKEFILDKLWDEKNNCPIFWSSLGEMNEYLGTDVPDIFNVYCDKNTSFTYGEWHFKSNDYVLKEQQKYFKDLSQHIGRYIRALVDNPHSGSRVYKGDIGKIINKEQVDFPNRKGYSCTCALDKNHLGTKYELLPEDYSPEQETIPERISFYVKYTEEFTEDLYNALWEWSKKNSEFSPRGLDDSYEELKRYKFYIFDNWTLNCHGIYGNDRIHKYSYGVDNNKQNCEEEYSIEQVKKLIGYKEHGVEFIPGKWYKLIDCENAYRKCSKIPVEDRLPYSELIGNSGYRCETGSSGDLTRIKLIEDLLEIQEYLPDRHPDKVKNFKLEVGKWYSFNWDYSGKDLIVIAKIKKVEEDYFAVSWRSYLWLDKSYSDSDAYRFKDISNIKELSMKEIQPYLPIGHPDKISSDEFKKGEYIVLIGKGQSTNSSNELIDKGFIQNHCYKVKENKSYIMVELDSSESTTNGWTCIPYNPNKFHKTRNWRYATQEEIDEYERRGKPYDVTELNKQSFPDEGSIEIEYIPKNLMSYLENNNRKSVSGDSSYNKEKVVIAWNKSSFWFCSVESSKPKYSKDFIEKIIGQSIYSNTLLEAKKELSMKEIQEECKKRFPIGCTFIDAHEDAIQVLKKDSVTYKINSNMIYAHDGAGCLYKNGKYATLVSIPEQDNLKEEAIKYSEKTNATILLASDIKSKELYSTYEETLLSTKLLSNKITSLINNVGVVSSVNLKIK